MRQGVASQPTQPHATTVHFKKLRYVGSDRGSRPSGCAGDATPPLGPSDGSDVFEVELGAHLGRAGGGESTVILTAFARPQSSTRPLDALQGADYHPAPTPTYADILRQKVCPQHSE